MPTAPNFPAVLHVAIRNSGKSLAQICRQLQAHGYTVNKGNLSRWGSGTSRPQAKQINALRALADLLNLSPEGKAEYRRALNAFYGIANHRPGSAALWYHADTLGEVTYFEGREAELAHLRATLTRRQSVVLHGLGGVGKTTLARYVLQTECTKFTHGCRAVRIYPHHTAVEVTRWVAQALGLPLPEALLRPTTLTLAYQELQHQLAGGDVLVLVDNVDHAQQVRALVAALPNITWLVTSRRQLTLPGLEPHHLHAPTPAAATQMLLAYTEMTAPTPLEVTLAGQLAQRLGHLPLAIRFASRLVTTFTVPGLTGLEAWLQTQGLNGLRLEHHHLPHFFTQLIATQPAPAQQALTLCGVFAKPRIARLLFKTLAEHLGWPSTALSYLHDLALIEWAPDGDAFELHPLVHEFARLRWATHPLQRTGQQLYTQLYAQFAVDHNRQYLILREEWPNLQAALELAWAYSDWATLLRCWAPISKQLWVMGDKAGYQAFDERCLQAARAAGEHSIEAAVLAELGWVALENGQLAQAAQLLTEAQTAQDALAQPLQQARVRRYRALLAILQDALPEAQHWVTEAHAYLKRAPGLPESRRLSQSLLHNVQAKVAFLQEDEALALREAEAAVVCCEAAGAEGHGYVPGMQLQLGDIYFDRDDIANARLWWQRAAEFDRPDFVEDSAVAGAWERLARLAALQAQWAEAQQAAETARQHYTRRGLPHHCQRLDTLLKQIATQRPVRAVFTPELHKERILRP